MKKLNLGCGRNPLEGFVNIDRWPGPGIDHAFDLESCGKYRTPFDDDTFDEVHASHVLEHIQNILPLMEEMHRITKPRGIFRIRVPHGGSDNAFEDPTHVRFFFTKSFFYFSQCAYGGADYGYRGDWSTDRLIFIVRERMVPTELVTMRNNKDPRFAESMMYFIESGRNVVDEFGAQLRCEKPVREAGTPPPDGVEAVFDFS